MLPLKTLQETPCWPLPSFLWLLTIVGFPLLVDAPLHSLPQWSVVFPLYLSTSFLLFLHFGIRANSMSVWPHLNMTQFAKSLIPNKVTFSSPGIRTWAYLLGTTQFNPQQHGWNVSPWDWMKHLERPIPAACTEVCCTGKERRGSRCDN